MTLKDISLEEIFIYFYNAIIEMGEAKCPRKREI